MRRPSFPPSITGLSRSSLVANYVLGISAYYHDSAAALVRDGIPVAAAQEERFTRKKQDPGFPANAVRYCLQESGITLAELDKVVYYENPAPKFRRTLSSFASAGPQGLSVFSRIAPEWLGWKRNALGRIDAELVKLGRGKAPPAIAGEHHRSHAAAAFYPSPFDRAAVLCIDGVGEWHTTSIWRGHGDSLELVNSISYPHSLGLLYSAFTEFCGFKVDSGEYKLMGLAPYGMPHYADKIRKEIIHLRDDGSFTINLKCFEFLKGERMVGDAFASLFDGPARVAEAPLTQRECDLAASIQVVTDEAVLALAKAAREMTGEENLCMAGGVALNCVSNGYISRSKLFSRLWVQPAAGDAGCALGAALDKAIPQSGRRSAQGAPGGDWMSGAYLGPAFDDDEIKAFLDKGGYAYRELPEAELLDEVADHLANGAVIGWFQGRMEFGPRSLGARSILGDPRNTAMQKTMNLRIKYRESFRPFAPSVLESKASEYFDMREQSPYMLIVSPVLEEHRASKEANRSLGSINEVRSNLPAITHIDFSARVQTVNEETNERYAKLLRRFEAKTGCPVLVNTSFNVRGEPIVCTPEDAHRCFMRTEIEVLVLGTHILLKSDQKAVAGQDDWRTEIPLD
jgi:carbamoyltransferase